MAVAAVSLTSARTVKWREGFGGLMFRVWGGKNLGWRVGCGGKGEGDIPLQRRREAMDEVLVSHRLSNKFGNLLPSYLWASCGPGVLFLFSNTTKSVSIYFFNIYIQNYTKMNFKWRYMNKTKNLDLLPFILFFYLLVLLLDHFSLI